MNIQPAMRIGQGYDIHRIQAGRALWLGGVEISCPFGLIGHSDADVLLHAVIDALLGALGLGDIGEWYPDTDPKYLRADSRELLRNVCRHPAFRGWRLENLDCTIFAELPKLLPYKRQIQKSLAELLEIAQDAVNVKAKTNEGLDSIGRGEAIAASATLLLRQAGNSQ